MKHKGSISQAFLRRDTIIIPDIYRRAKSLATYPTTTENLFKIAADLSVDKYYISDDAALRYVRRRYYKGERKKFLSPFKEKLFNALYEKVLRMMEEEKYREQGLATTIILALNTPAPCIGLSPLELYGLYKRGRRSHSKQKGENDKV